MEKLLKAKKGALERLYPAIMTLVIVGILLGVALIVLGKFMDNTTNADADTSINETIQALGDFSGWFGIIVVVIAAGVILSIVISSFAGAKKP